LRQASKRDTNEARIVRYLRRCGIGVVQLNQERLPDLLVAVPSSPFHLLWEVKGAKGKLTVPQQKFNADWSGKIEVIRSITDVKQLLRSFMPIYLYRCLSCVNEFEIKQKFQDEPLTICPKCGSTLARVPARVSVIFKGEGWGSKAGESNKGK